MGVMINKHATEHPECKPTLTCIGVYRNLGSANLGWCPFEIERPSVFVLVLSYTANITWPVLGIAFRHSAPRSGECILRWLIGTFADCTRLGHSARLFWSDVLVGGFGHGKSNFGGVIFRSKWVKFGDQPPYNTIYIRHIPHKTA